MPASALVMEPKSAMKRRAEAALGGPSSPVQSKIAFKSVAPGAIPVNERGPQPGSKRRRSIVTKAAVVHALELDFKQHVHLHPIYASKGGMMQIVKMSPPEFANPKTRVPVRVQLSGGGRIPFAVAPNQYGGYHVSFTLTDKDEIKKLKEIDEEVLAYAISNRDKLWPAADQDDGKVLSEYAIRDRYRPLVVLGTKRDDGERWDPCIKLKIPINMNTGEPNACKLNGRTKVCRIMDSDDAIVSMYDIEKRDWDRIVFDMSGVYFQNKAWGIGPKTLSIVKLTHDYEAEADYQDVELMPVPLKRQRCDPDDTLTQETLFDGTPR